MEAATEVKEDKKDRSKDVLQVGPRSITQTEKRTAEKEGKEAAEKGSIKGTEKPSGGGGAASMGLTVAEECCRDRCPSGEIGRFLYSNCRYLQEFFKKCK